MNQEIKAKIKGYFHNRLNMFDYKNGWMKGNCPFCGKENKFGVHISGDKSNCFVCGSHGKLLQAIQQIEGHETQSETFRFINNTSEFEGYEFKEERFEIAESKELYLPDGFKLLTDGKSTLAKSARSYIKKRGFEVDVLSRKGWGYGTKDKFFGYLIIPFLQAGRLVYYNARLFQGDGPRYNNPTKDVTGLGKSFIWYNRDSLDIYDQIYICEGAINAETLGDKAISSGGKSLSRYQINVIIKSNVKRVVICLDRDAMGKAIKLASELIDYKKVSIVQFPDSRDINDLGKTKTMRLIYETPYLDKKELNQLKNTYSRELKEATTSFILE